MTRRDAHLGRDAHGAPTRHLRHVLPAVLDAVGLADALDVAPGEGGAPTAQDARAARTRFDLPRADRAVVVLVDGLGALNLDTRAGHAPFLRRLLHSSPADPATGLPTAHTCAPTTTAAAITAFGTGALPGSTAMVGYEVADPVSGRPVGLLGFEGASLDPRSTQTVATLAERAVRARGEGLLTSVGPARFVGSGLTRAALRGWGTVPAESLADRVGAALRTLRRDPTTRVLYLYWDGVDHVGHAAGWESDPWVAALEDLDAELARLAAGLARLEGENLLVVTADHGMVDVDRRHDLSALPDLARDVRVVAGDQRAPHLYLAEPGRRADPSLAASVAQRWREHLDAHGAPGARVLTHADLVAAGGASCPLGPLGARAETLVGDVVMFLGGRDVVVDPRTQSSSALAMRGVHGSLSDAESLVPVLSTLT